MRENIKTWQGLALGSMLGLIGGIWLGSLPGGSRAGDSGPAVGLGSRVSERGPALETAALEGGDEAEERTSDPETWVRSDPPRSAAPRTPEELISEGLLDYAESEIRRGWNDVRIDSVSEEELDQGIQEFKQLVLEAPRDIGAELGRLKSMREIEVDGLPRGGAFELLAALESGGVGPLPQVVQNEQVFQQLFRPRESTGGIDGPAHSTNPRSVLRDGSDLLFPPGVYRVENLMSDDHPFPRDVSLIGSGMDATLLLVGDLSTSYRLENFVIRDCTIYTENNPLLNLRLQNAIVRLERVRFVGFDSGSGGANLFDLHSAILYALECRFEGGYGKLPTSGSILDVRNDALLARFDRCHFSQIELEIWQLRPGTTVLFHQCVMAQILDDPARFLDQRPGVRFEKCAIDRFYGDRTMLPRKDLNDIFPGWEAAAAR